MRFLQQQILLLADTVAAAARLVLMLNALLIFFALGRFHVNSQFFLCVQVLFLFSRIELLFIHSIYNRYLLMIVIHRQKKSVSNAP